MPTSKPIGANIRKANWHNRRLCLRSPLATEVGELGRPNEVHFLRRVDRFIGAAANGEEIETDIVGRELGVELLRRRGVDRRRRVH